MNDTAKIVAQRQKAYVDAVEGCMQIASRSIKDREYSHAADMLKCAIDHLGAAAVIEKVLKDIESARKAK